MCGVSYFDTKKIPPLCEQAVLPAANREHHAQRGG